MVQDVFIPFVSAALAELGDKTQVTVMLLASRTSKRAQLFWGVMLGFFLVDGLAVVAGAWLTRLVPAVVVKWVSGILFLFFGVMMLRNHEEKEKHSGKNNQSPFWTGLAMISAAEWGDKTKIAAALFAAKFHPAAVLAGTLGALAILTALAILAGGWVSRRIPEAVVHKTAGILFIGIGISCWIF